MRLAIMQPYFFPYLGYFELIAQVDQWIVFDTPQYSKLGWTNRNRVLHPHSGWQYIGVPLRKAPLATPIRAIQAADKTDWRDKLLRQLAHYRRRAPHYRQTIDLARRALNCDSSSLAGINVHALEVCCRHLEIAFPWRWHSDTAATHTAATHTAATDTAVTDTAVTDTAVTDTAATAPAALQIAVQLGADTYVNSPGGAQLYDVDQFARHGIKLVIQPPCTFSYDTAPYEFQPSLSILDVLMWNSAERVRAHLASIIHPSESEVR